ncbi:MAG TPA: AmmeMemoRadiSam system protein A [Clostridia bacterium]|nr:AmmeMemoRadiSam system protein A [Clostridia bacterium]
MGRIGTCYLVPHPPIIVPEIGQGEEKKAQKTIEAMEEVAGDIAKKKPELIIVITPHGPLFRDSVAVSARQEFKGDFGRFGQPGVSLSFTGSHDMAFGIMEEAAREGIPVTAVDDNTRRKYGISDGLDHGALVPLYYINRSYQGFGLVHITYGLLPPEQLYSFGKCIRRAVEKRKKHASILCSGDLSHRLIRGAPAGYSKKGAVFDQSLVESLRKMDVDRILDMDPRLLEEAGECGYRSVVIMLGALDGHRVESRILSYEGPYGVGYCVASFEPLQPDPERARKEKDTAIQQKGDSCVELARLALETYVTKGKIIDPPEGLPEEMLSKKAGVFVSLKLNGRLRGCIGTISSTTDSIAREIISNAISAGVRDPRFYPVGPEELGRLEYSVDVLGQPEAIESIEDLDVKRYGVIVRSGRRSGLLLPDIEGVDTPRQQVAIALQKAGIRPGEPYQLERFEVIRHR